MASTSRAGERDPVAIRNTLSLIKSGGPLAHAHDAMSFANRELLLPRKPDGHYRLYTVATNGQAWRGSRRIVTGADGEFYYTHDHYRSFIRIDGTTGVPIPVLEASEMTATGPTPPPRWKVVGNVVIDAAGVHSKDGFMALIAQSLGFPAYFGGNWDAVEECLADRDWPPGGTCEIILRHADALRGADPSVIATFSAIVHDVAQMTCRTGVDLRLIVEDN